MIRDFDTLIDRVTGLSIRDVVEKYTGQTLNRKGANYTMPCPWCGGGKGTPSFFVNDRKNICKCYSCEEGGDVLSFVKKYRKIETFEAVKLLAADFSIPYEVEHKERTPEQEEYHKKREAAYILMENAARFYAGQLTANKEKTEYVKSRWGQSNLDTILFGYADEEWDSLLKHAQSNAWSIPLMEELGLLTRNEKSNKYRDSFRNRIMIPIEDRRGRIIGFTARNVGPDTYTKQVGGEDKEISIAKYINSKESFLFTKGDHLFGLSAMKRSRGSRERIYIVEGAADVLSINALDIYNVVAPMGTALTDAQIELMQKEGIKDICFIPDQDVIKPGQTDGPGMTNALKNARHCVQKGFSVFFKIIPSKPEDKQDPGSYFTSKELFNGVEEIDFIFEYAKRAFAGIDVDNIQKRDTARKDVAALLKEVQEESIRDAYISRLSTLKWGKVKEWRDAISGEVKKEIKENREDTEGANIYERYGFFIEDNSYKTFTESDGNSYKTQWSNFFLTPLFHIKDSINPKRLYKITNKYRYSEIIELKQEDMTSLSKFKTKVEGLGNFIWEAGERELTKVKKYLYRETKSAVEITQLGWQKSEGIYAFGNGIFDGEKFQKIDNYGIVKVPIRSQSNSRQRPDQEGREKFSYYYLPAFSDIYKYDQSLFQFERFFIHKEYADISLYDYATKMIGVFGDNAKVGLIFVFASLFKDVIIQHAKFPVLNLFGPKGAGKTEMGISLMSFFISDNKPLNITSSTKAGMADAVAQVSNAIVHLDEYKNSIELDKREFLKGLWDSTGRTRMNMDKDKKREMTSVDCGVIVSGQEMASADIALFSRFVFLCFSQTKYNDQEKARFDDLKQIRDAGVSHLTLELLKLRDVMVKEFHANYNAAGSELNEEVKKRRLQVDDRIYRNWLTMLATFRTLHQYLTIPFHYIEMRDIIVDMMARHGRECDDNNEMAEFWDIISYLSQRREIYMGAEFRICSENILKCTGKEPIETKQPKEYLYLNKKTIFQLYQKQAAMGGTEKPLAKNSLIYYLSTSPEFVGEKNSVRFKVIIRGQEELLKDKGGNAVNTTQQAQAMIFDYDLVKEHYGIDLDVYDDSDQSITTGPSPAPAKQLPF